MFEVGEPCGHPGCLSHVSHPCEGCGRVAGVKKHKVELLVTQITLRCANCSSTWIDETRARTSDDIPDDTTATCPECGAVLEVEVI